MADKTGIEWTKSPDGTKGATWNPVVGCSKISAGCANCYAETVDKRFAAQWGHEFRPWTTANAAHNVRLHEERLDQPLRWKRSRRIFVNSINDLFHEQVPYEYIRRVFAVMGAADWHTFMVLTKRPERMKEVLNGFLAEKDFATWYGATEPAFPWPNVWIGVSVENQQAADERIPLLLQTPAAVRFLSMEPLLGVVDLLKNGDILCRCDGCLDMTRQYPDTSSLQRIDWVVAGGESGPNARPMHPQWIRDIRDQCVGANVPFFFKQWGTWAPASASNIDYAKEDYLVGTNGEDYQNVPLDQVPSTVVHMVKLDKKKAGRVLDGQNWNEMPVKG